MGPKQKLGRLLLGGVLSLAGCYATEPFQNHDPAPACPAPAIPVPQAAPVPESSAPTAFLPVPLADCKPLPINLPTALQLANVRAVDVAAATERIKAAVALLEQARVLWLPTITVGGDYNRHDGPVQNNDGTIVQASHSSMMFGVGSGLLNAAVLNVCDAIFGPLYARQQVKVREADLQTASNDTLVAVSNAYFNAQQARGELAGATESTRRMEQLVERTQKLVPDLFPELETDRAEAELARRRQAESTARQRWKVASAELLRVLRLDPTAQVEPVEPPQLRVELIDLSKPVDELIPIALTNRPELASQQALVQATLIQLKQEKLRPLIPSVLLRGYSTPVTGTLAYGLFAGGTNSTIANVGSREDVDLQLLWQLNNLGFGNLGLAHQRKAENNLAIVELFRLQDRVAAEVAQAHAEAREAAQRVGLAEKGVQSAVRSADKNLVALGETKKAGNLLVTLVRPQEVVASIQALAQAYSDYFAAVAEANRAQFALYRALGNPAQCLVLNQAPDPSVSR